MTACPEQAPAPALPFPLLARVTSLSTAVLTGTGTPVLSTPLSFRSNTSALPLLARGLLLVFRGEDTVESTLSALPRLDSAPDEVAVVVGSVNPSAVSLGTVVAEGVGDVRIAATILTWLSFPAGVVTEARGEATDVKPDIARDS